MFQNVGLFQSQSGSSFRELLDISSFLPGGQQTQQQQPAGGDVMSLLFSLFSQPTADVAPDSFTLVQTSREDELENQIASLQRQLNELQQSRQPEPELAFSPVEEATPAPAPEPELAPAAPAPVAEPAPAPAAVPVPDQAQIYKDTYTTLANSARANQNFDEQFYLQRNPDVAAAVANGTFSSGRDHFNRHGKAEGRYLNQQHAFAGEHGKLQFDAEKYKALNPDVAAAGVDPLRHFLTFGIFEGRKFQD